MVFYPDNENRATRLQQLVDSMANLQTNVKDMGKDMDEKNAKYRPAINKLLKANGMDSIDDLINKVAAKMTPEERKVFEALVKTAKGSKAGFDTTYFVCSLLMVPEGAVLTGKLAIAIVKWGTNMVSLKALADFFKAAETGTEAAAAAAAEAAAGAEEAEKTLQGAGEAGVEVSKSMVWLGRLGTFFKVLGAVGLVITIIAGIIELVEGEEQKKKLVAAIHGLQPARLTTAFFKREGTKIMEQLTTLQLYLDASPGGSDPDPTIAAYIGKKLIKKIAEEQAAIDLNELEGELEREDRSSSLFYGGDDLSRAEVVATAAPDTK
ncbi:hypothetical protein GSI_11362 [Ganoderma sinense ZZ0214-1]|uniref:Uncharacterized protein n=1 Tax=Ganoderma sinense ZZ0214-1 TaxID=1077348 RepID=A0A2G8RVS9_9APHY|nr:hypothetical protein GSI_11362 [Ganoderma sinense ZZ0214-1]